MQITERPKLRGPDLKQFILLTICTCSEPVKTKDLLQIIQLTHDISARTIYSKLKELQEDGEIIKKTCLKRSNCVYYFSS